MKRHLVIISSAQLLNDDVEIVAAQERKRLEAYLYGHSTLVAVIHDVQQGTNRIHQSALVVVEGDDAERLRYLANYQADRLRSGSFGVEDYVEDEQAARRAVGIVEEVEPSLAEALEYAASCLAAEEVEYSLGLDSDHLSCSYVVENGVERERTEADLDAEIARHRQFIKVLADAAKTASWR